MSDTMYFKLLKSSARPREDEGYYIKLSAGKMGTWSKNNSGRIIWRTRLIWGERGEGVGD